MFSFLSFRKATPVDSGRADAVPAIRKVLALACFGFSSLAQAAVSYYVDPVNGSDTLAGTGVDKAFKTIQRAAQVVNPGDTVYLRGGVHNTTRNTLPQFALAYISRDGTEIAPITFTNYPGETPIVSTVGPGGDRTGSFGSAFHINAKWVVFRGLTVVGNRSLLSVDEIQKVENLVRTEIAVQDSNLPRLMYQYGFSVIPYSGRSPAYITIENCTVRECAGAAVAVQSTADYVTIRNNVIYDNLQRNNSGTSAINIIELSGIPNGIANDTRIVVENNTVYNNENLFKWTRDSGGARLSTYSDGNGVIVDVSPEYTGRILIRNNFIFNNGGFGIAITRSRNVDVFNNTTMRNGKGVGLLTSASWGEVSNLEANTRYTTNFIRNNIFWRRNGKNQTNGTFDGTNSGYNLFWRDGTGNLSAQGAAGVVLSNPLFLDAPTTDFDDVVDLRVSSSSPALNAGTALSLVPTDAFGTTRPQGAIYDIGAYEEPVTTTPLTIPDAAPGFTAEPTNQSVYVGYVATFTAAATGSPSPAYQWQRYLDGVWQNLPGKTSATYSTYVAEATDDGAQFRVVATNSSGSVTSAAATLSVSATPATITRQPANVTVVSTRTATLTATLKGAGPITYQWQRLVNSVWTDISGARAVLATTPGTASYAFTATIPDDQASFRVVASNDLGTATSDALTLTVNELPAFPVQPVATTGANTVFTVQVTGYPTPTYRWQRLPAGSSDWVNLNNDATYAGVTTTTLTVTGATAAGDQFRCVATNRGAPAASPVNSSAVAVVAAPAGYKARQIDSTSSSVSMPAAQAFELTVAGAGTAFGGLVDKGLILAGTSSATGDFAAVARLTSLTSATNATLPVAAITIRDTLSPNSVAATLAVNGKNEVRLHWRTPNANNVLTANSATYATTSLPQWLMLLRVESTVYAYASSDGLGFTLLGSAPVALAPTVEAGLGVAAGGAANAQAAFSSFSLIVPSAPGALAASATSDTAISLQWTAAGSDVRGYIVQKDVGGTWTDVITVASDATTYSVSELAPATSYRFRVRPVYLYGNGPASNEATARTLIRIDARVQTYGSARYPYGTIEAGKQNTGLSLTSLGRVYSNTSVATGTVWRIRNASVSERTVTLSATGGGFSTTLTIPALTDAFVLSSVATGTSSHVLFYQGVQIDVKAAGTVTFSDNRLVEGP